MKNILLALFIFFFSNVFSQDLLVFRNGKILEVKILEVTSEEIKYKKEEIPTGPTYSDKKVDVCYIQYPTFRDIISDCSTGNVTQQVEKVDETIITQPPKQTVESTITTKSNNIIEDVDAFKYFKLINGFVLKAQIRNRNTTSYTIEVYDEDDDFWYETILLKSNIKEEDGEESILSQLYSYNYDDYKEEVASITKLNGEVFNFIFISQDFNNVYFKLIGYNTVSSIPTKDIASTTTKVIDLNKKPVKSQSSLFAENAKITVLTSQGNRYDVAYIRETIDSFYFRDSRSANIVPMYKGSIAEINSKPFYYTASNKNIPGKNSITTAPVVPAVKVEDPATSGVIMLTNTGEEIDAVEIKEGATYFDYKIRETTTVMQISKSKVFRIKYKNGRVQLVTN